MGLILFRSARRKCSVFFFDGGEEVLCQEQFCFKCCKLLEPSSNAKVD